MLLSRHSTLRFYSPLRLNATLRRSSRPRLRMLLHLHITLLNLHTTLLFLPNSGWRFGNTSRTGFASRPRKSRLRRLPVIGVVELRTVASRCLASLGLSADWSYMGLTRGGKFSRLRTHIDATPSAVVAHTVLDAAPVVDIVVNHSAIVGVAAASNVGDGAVVVEVIAVPVAAKVADAYITEAVINSAVVADMETPVARMEAVTAAIKAPIRRGPERTIVGRRTPDSGNPVVAAIAPTPVARSPDVIWIGSRRLVIIRERRWGLGGVVGGILGVVLIGVVRRLCVALFHGRGSLLIALTLLLWSISGTLAKDLSGLAAIDWSKIAIGRLWSAAGIRCRRRVFAGSQAESQAGSQSGCAKWAKPKGFVAVCRHRSNS